MANNESSHSSGWVSSMETMLGSVASERIKPCSIFRVPEQLRKSEKEAEAYTPKVVSIGPLHRGTKTELLYMEEIKYHCMLSLLLRTDGALERFSKCSKAILKLDDSVRAFYVDDIKFNNYELAKIMLLDGCFLLELLISNAEQSDPDISTTLQSFLGLKFNRNSSESDAPAKARNKGEVLSDLKLIENQIPLLVLVLLFQLLFTKDSDIMETYIPVRNMIHRLALPLFGCSPSPCPECKKQQENPVARAKNDEKLEKNIAHLVELVHTFLTEKQGHRHSITIKTSRTSGERISVKRISGKRNYKTAPELKCCAARFKAAGIEIKPYEEQSEGMKESNDDVTRIEIKPDEEQSEGMKQSNDDVTRIEIKPVEEQQSNDGVKFSCYTRFTDKTLEILHPLNITEETEILWRNFIAWEQNRITREKYLAIENDRTSCEFSEFALLFKDLVCCEHDIKLLKDQNVLTVTNEKNWSNEKLMTFFHTIADQIDVSENSEYVQMIKVFNVYSGGCGNCGMVGHKCRRVLTNTWYFWTILIRTRLEILKRDYTPNVWRKIGLLAAVLLLFLTIAQTVLTAVGL